MQMYGLKTKAVPLRKKFRDNSGTFYRLPLYVSGALGASYCHLYFQNQVRCKYAGTQTHNTMSLQLTVEAAIKEAMKAKDASRLRGLREIKAQILLALTEGSGNAVDEDREIKILQKMKKQRQDSLDIYKQQGRADLALKEEEELAVLDEFLPKQMDAAELESVLTALIAELGATSGKDMGRVMGAANKQLQGKADGRMISETVKRLLA